MIPRAHTASIILTILCAHRSLAALPTVIFSNIQSSPTSDVPGIPGLKFSTLQGSFDRPFGSPDGERWILRAGGAGRMFVVGAGTDRSTATVPLRSFTPTFFDNTIVYETLRANVGINDAGSFIFAADTNAATNSDEIGARWTPESGFELIAREGVQAVGQPPGVGYVGAGYPHILADHRVAFLSGLTNSPAVAAFLNTAINNGVVLLQTGLTIPDHQVQPGTALSSFGAFATDATGTNYLYTGRLANGHDVITINNVTVAERDMPLPGDYPGVFNDPDTGDDGGSISPYNGHYAYRCAATLATGNGDVVVVDGEVVAATDEPILPGSPEYWDNFTETPFVLNVVNSRGDYVVGGIAQRPGFPQHAPLIWNGTTELVRGGVPVDLDGDGLPNDNVYFGFVHTDAAYLTDNGRLYCRARLHNASNQPLGEAFMWLPVPVPGEMNCDGTIDFFDIDPFLLALFDQPAYAAAYPDCWPITADINRDGLIDFFDIDPFLECLFAVCP